MKKRFRDAVEQSTEIHALFVLGVVLFLRAWRAIPTLRPHQILIPATISQITVFIISVFNIEQFIIINAIGNMLIVGIALFPSTFQKQKSAIHWVKSDA